MVTASVYEAKTQFSKLVSEAEQGRETVITRLGKPVARIAPLAASHGVRLGALKGRIRVSDDFDEFSEDDARDWYGE